MHTSSYFLFSLEEMKFAHECLSILPGDVFCFYFLGLWRKDQHILIMYYYDYHIVNLWNGVSVCKASIKCYLKIQILLKRNT